MLDALMKRIDDRYPNSSGGIINKLTAAKNMIIALDPALLDEVVPMPPPKIPPKPDPIPVEPPPAAKKKRGGRR